MKKLFLIICLLNYSSFFSQYNFKNLAEGPFKKLVIQEVMVIPGHGGPPVGPYDIVIEGNLITKMIALDPISLKSKGKIERETGDKIIDGKGKYVMPGMIDLHTHLRTDPMPLEYIYYLKLAHGVTAMVPAADRGLKSGLDEAEKSRKNKILAPRLYPIWSYGAMTGYDKIYLDNYKNVKTVIDEMFQKGAHVVNVGNLGWNQKLLGEVCKEVKNHGGITTYHIPPSTTAITKAIDAARLGVTMIEHHYAYAESALDRNVQNFKPTYNYNDENERFRQAGVVWSETNKHKLLVY